MPKIKSAKKALRQSKTKRARNIKRLNAYRSAIKNFKKLLLAGKNEEAKKYLPKVYKALDKAKKRGVIKANKSSRLKSKSAQSLAK
ncbi:MAG: 30S ribosomal protein S20 [Candidatus Yanofskybacteria bacterium CG10_big_fil_rev_8_21_14_0_10_37_15]|uniref:Small ribosomal subunit protein bS20 n=1 Tax=Candidatus Yanofskybacteria bacterium CG10_big_fil_rev_8_21_14_0_10_37_15 TaxID=1975097 RepID=A0A2H0R750_9BACT|nr:MAG: 30S ribosomal protein S20 [Candidatus Yanofskybacteria bacterium CG10_big_fil_rev_8_21_14_0_10_37_15]